MMHRLRALLPAVRGLALALVAAALCEWARVPLPWMIGPMYCAIVFVVAQTDSC